MLPKIPAGQRALVICSEGMFYTTFLDRSAFVWDMRTTAPWDIMGWVDSGKCRESVMGGSLLPRK